MADENIERENQVALDKSTYLLGRGSELPSQSFDDTASCRRSGLAKWDYAGDDAGSTRSNRLSNSAPSQSVFFWLSFQTRRRLNG